MLMTYFRVARVSGAAYGTLGSGFQGFSERSSRAARLTVFVGAFGFWSSTHRPLSSSFLWLIFRILFYGNPKKELLRGL